MNGKKTRKLVVIGAGSAYAPEIFSGVVENNSELGIGEIALVDIESGMGRAKIIQEFGKRIFKKNNIECDIGLTVDRRAALDGADFVISQIRVGGAAARMSDELAGINLGLCGQETTGAGGFLNAMRTIPVALEIAKDIEDICPDAWLINFTNPAGMVTQAILDHSNIKCVGLCNVPVNMHRDISVVLGVPQESVRTVFMGLNHLSYVTAVENDGRDMLKAAAERISENETLMKNIPKVPGVGGLIRRIGIIPSPYLQYYYFEKEMTAKQTDEYARTGETRGATVAKIDNELFDKFADPLLDHVPEELSSRGGSLYSFAALNLIKALTGDTPVELVLNVQNKGACPDFLPGDVLEINCMVSKNGITPVACGGLPPVAAGLVQSVKQYERLTVKAAVNRDYDAALEALLNHPLVHGYNNAVKLIDSIKA